MNNDIEQIQSKVDSWSATEVMFNGELANDLQALTQFCQTGEAILAEASTKDETQRLLKASVHQANRNVRHAFLNTHAANVYNQLTQQKTVRLTLNELVYTAAEQFPGLVPTHAQMAQELTYIQSEKEGRELDQGLFFSKVMKDKLCGEHLMESMLQPSQKALDLMTEYGHQGFLDFGKITIERLNEASHITFKNEHCLNAEDNELIEMFELAVDIALLDDATHVCVMRGGVVSHPKYAGKRIFSAGINLKDLHQGKISFVDFLLKREFGYINKIQRGLICDKHAVGGIAKRYEKPWIAAVDTFAIGGGCQLLFVADHVVAGADSYINLPAATEGIVPGLGNLRLTRAVGTRIARQIVLKGRKLWASEPDAKLLVDEVVEPKAMDQAVEAAVQALNSPAVISNRHMFPIAEEPLDMLRDYLAEFAWVQAERAYAPDVMNKVKKM